MTSCTHPPSTIAVLYSLGPYVHKPGECMGREEKRIGIIIRFIQWSCILLVFITPTCVLLESTSAFFSPWETVLKPAVVKMCYPKS